MNIYHVNVNGNNYNNEINYTPSMHDTDILRQAIEHQSEEHTALTKAVNELIEAIESKKHSAIRNTACEVISNIGSGTIAKVLGSSALELINHLANI